MKLQEIKSMDHLGMVSGMCDEIGLVRRIDSIVGVSKDQKVTAGELSKAMVLNCLGFTSRPLYLFGQFFSTKPLELLLRKGITADMLNDDVLGRTLDKLYDAGCDKIFSAVAHDALVHFQVDRKFAHMDTTSVSVHGEYEDGEGLITFGYSKDDNPGLKQFLISLMVTNDGGIPFLARTVAGNTSDQKHFRKTLKELRNQIRQGDSQTYYIADSSLYSKETINQISPFKWITRVPRSIRQVRALGDQYTRDQMSELGNGYWCKQIPSDYGGVKQRWLLIFSEKAYKREKETVMRNVAKEEKALNTQLKKLSGIPYSCEKDAIAACNKLLKQAKFHELAQVSLSGKNKKQGRGRPGKKDQLTVEIYAKPSIVQSHSKIEQVLQSKGKFVIATNELDQTLLSDEQVLSYYKDQQKVERGFRFLKDPLFMTSSVFLKNEKRIVALAMLMCLALLVYSLLERKLRKALKRENQTIPNQKNKPTQRPTVRWVFQIFEGVYIAYFTDQGKTVSSITGIDAVRRTILSFLGSLYLHIYGVEDIRCGM